MFEQPSRRAVLAGAVAGSAAIAAGPALGQSRSDTTAKPADPQTKYTRDPFPEQRQKWPGLQREMRPVLDSGERSYVGSGKLRGRKALVTGGDSGIGRELGQFGQDTPLGRAGQPAELAGLYVALASGELSYTDGSIFGANGGMGTI